MNRPMILAKIKELIRCIVYVLVFPIALLKAVIHSGKDDAKQEQTTRYIKIVRQRNGTMILDEQGAIIISGVLNDPEVDQLIEMHNKGSDIVECLTEMPA